VSGTGLAASLTPIGEGAAMGLLAASSAMATLAGTILTGPLIQAVGYQVVAPIAIVGLLSAAVLTGQLHGELSPDGADDGGGGGLETALVRPDAVPGSPPSSDISTGNPEASAR
jgi:hypothetical protein